MKINNILDAVLINRLKHHHLYVFIKQTGPAKGTRNHYAQLYL